MVVDSKSTWGSIQSGFLDFFGSTLRSTIWTAVLITIILLLIIITIYPAKRNAPFSSLFKLILYMFSAIVLVLFLHGKALKTIWLEESKEKEVEETMEGIRNYNKVGGSIFDVIKEGGNVEPRVDGGSNVKYRMIEEN